MVPTKLRAVGWLWVVPVLLLPAGCTNSDELNSSVGTVRIELQMTNTQVPFALAKFNLLQILTEPVNEQADNVIQPNPVGLLNGQSFDEDSNANFIVFYDDPPNYQRNVTLPSGQYRLEQIELQAVLFTDSTPPCRIDVPVLSLYFSTPIGDFLPPTIITSRPDRAGVLTLTFDGAKFLEVCQDALFQSGGCGQITGELLLSFVYARASEFLTLQASS